MMAKSVLGRSALPLYASVLPRSCTRGEVAVEGFSEVLAKEVGSLGIKVTIIEPGASAPIGPATHDQSCAASPMSSRSG